MAFPSVQYTFANSTTADGTQVNQNFTDLINGLSDGTKSISIAAATLAGALTTSGSVTLGLSTSNTLTVNASLASSIPVSVTNSYDIGSDTFGLASVYFGSGSSAHSTRVKGASVASAYTLTLPLTAGTASYLARTDGSGTLSFQHPNLGYLSNISISASVGTNALTIAVKDASGSDASSTSPIDVIFRNVTSATGTPVIRRITGALSVVVSSGSTLGSTSAFANWVYVYLIDNAGTVELAVCGSKRFEDGTVVTTTAEGGGGAADDKYTLYSTTLRSNVPARLIGRVKSTQATAGTWVTAPSEISLYPFENGAPRSVVTVDSGNGHGSSSTKIRRFTNARLNVGSAITYADSSTLGGTFTINEDGCYAISYNDFATASFEVIAITVNDTALTTNADTPLTYAQGLRSMGYSTAASVNASTAWTGLLAAGDIVRAHTRGNASATDGNCMFTIAQVSK